MLKFWMFANWARVTMGVVDSFRVVSSSASVVDVVVGNDSCCGDVAGVSRVVALNVCSESVVPEVLVSVSGLGS